MHTLSVLGREQNIALLAVLVPADNRAAAGMKASFETADGRAAAGATGQRKGQGRPSSAGTCRLRTQLEYAAAMAVLAVPALEPPLVRSFQSNAATLRLWKRSAVT